MTQKALKQKLEKNQLIERNSVLIWKTDLDINNDIKFLFNNILSLDEQTRANQFIKDKLKNRFTVSRTSLRLILSHFLATTPSDIIFTYSKFGKPEIIKQQNPKNIKFNVSHSENTAIFALSLERPVGIDIEQIHQIDNYLKISQRFFSKQETAALSKQPENIKKLEFFKIWTRKEAVIKTSGKGLFQELKSFSTVTDNKKQTKVQINETTYIVKDLKSNPKYTAAICLEGQELFKFKEMLFEIPKHIHIWAKSRN